MFSSLFIRAFSFLSVASLAWLTFGDDTGKTSPPTPDETTPADLFEQRIMPIFRSPQPSSCIQCHLASVDLKNYILPSHTETFVSLRDQGLIDLDDPDKSKILELIEMGNRDRDKGARLIHAEMRQAEYEAFANWIVACCNDSELRNLPAMSEDKRARPEKPDEVIRHARKNRVVNSFVRNIWSQRLRCFPCHTPHEIKPEQKAALKKQQDFETQYGENMRIFRETPQETIQYLVERSQSQPDGQLPLLNLVDPEKSLLVLKPISKLPRKNESGEFQAPSFSGNVTHMGGLKMHVDDQSYKSFIAWIQDYSNVVGNRYHSVNELPADNWFPTKRVIKVKQAPESWPVGTPVQLFVHSWDDQAADWSAEPVAFTQGTVTPRRMVNGALFLLKPQHLTATDAWNRADVLSPNKQYLVRAYVDEHGRLAEDPTALLGQGEYRGQSEIPNARWRVGFPKAEVIAGASFVR